MVLIALYTLGGSSDQMRRYAARFEVDGRTEFTNRRDSQVIRHENWRELLGVGAFSNFIEFFEDWTGRTSIDVVLKESLPILMTGISSVAYHALLRLSYALDYGDVEEVMFSLAYWASTFYPCPEIDDKTTSVEPDIFLADIVKNAATLQIRQTNSIDGRIRQVYNCTEIDQRWKPIRSPDVNPLEKVSALILETFAQTQHFTLLHALTSCQALRYLLPFLIEPKPSVSHYWHSVCAAYITVCRSSFSVGANVITKTEAEWKDIFARAVACEKDLEHTIKLAYACFLEFQHYGRDEYIDLAFRELNHASPFV
jgi:hypothetical protein